MVETPNRAPRIRVHLLRLVRVMVVEVLSWDKMIVRVGMLWARMVLLFCEVGSSIVVGFVCWRSRCVVFLCVLVGGD